MEVLMPSMDFNFDSVSSTPFSSAPSSPKLFSGEACFSAPPSPWRAAPFYREISFVQRTPSSSAVTDTNYKEEPDQLVKPSLTDEPNQDFAFGFSGELGKPSLSADELFDQGRIRPLETLKQSSVLSPKTPKLKQAKRNKANPSTKIPKQEQGRERVSVDSSKPTQRSRSTKSLSGLSFEDAKGDEQNKLPITANSKSSYYYFFTCWKLKDLILFRSASEGRADELKKYTASNRKQKEVRKPSFRSMSSSSSSSGSKRGRGPVSALEFHYKLRKPVGDELKRRTYLPYTTGLFGCARFKPTNWFTGSLNSSTRR